MDEYVEISLTDCTRIIIDEVAFLKCRQKEVAWTYGMALLSERRGRDNPDWKAINAAILDRWKPSGLERIKKMAWKLVTGETPADLAALAERPIPFSATRQCCWCGSDNTKGAVGYAGEPGCPTCGWGGNGEPDVPCMFYKLALRARSAS